MKEKEFELISKWSWQLYSKRMHHLLVIREHLRYRNYSITKHHFLYYLSGFDSSYYYLKLSKLLLMIADEPNQLPHWNGLVSLQ